MREMLDDDNWRRWRIVELQVRKLRYIKIEGKQVSDDVTQ